MKLECASNTQSHARTRGVHDKHVLEEGGYSSKELDDPNKDGQCETQQQQNNSGWRLVDARCWPWYFIPRIGICRGAADRKLGKLLYRERRLQDLSWGSPLGPLRSQSKCAGPERRLKPAQAPSCCRPHPPTATTRSSVLVLLLLEIRPSSPPPLIPQRQATKCLLFSLASGSWLLFLLVAIDCFY